MRCEYVTSAGDNMPQLIDDLMNNILFFVWCIVSFFFLGGGEDALSYQFKIRFSKTILVNENILPAELLDKKEVLLGPKE